MRCCGITTLTIETLPCFYHLRAARETGQMWLEDHGWNWLQQIARRRGSLRGLLPSEARLRQCHIHAQGCKGPDCMAWRWRGAKSSARRHILGDKLRHTLIHRPRGYCAKLEPFLEKPKPKHGRLAHSLRNLAAILFCGGAPIFIWWLLAERQEIADGHLFVPLSLFGHPLFPGITSLIPWATATYLWMATRVKQ